jgi:hypothetical protein
MAAAVVTSTVKLAAGVAQFAVCAAAALAALALGATEKRTLVVNGYTLELWSSCIFYVLGALQAVCSLQGVAMVSRVSERIEAVLLRWYAGSASGSALFRESNPTSSSET